MQSNFERFRPHTNRLLELLDQGVLNTEELVRVMVMWIDDKDIANLCKLNEIDIFSNGEEEDE